MKVFKVIFVVLLLSIIASCDKKGDIYDDYDKPKDDKDVADDDKILGKEGDPCNFSSDCMSDLKCLDKVCVKDVVEYDNDKIEPDEDDNSTDEEDVDNITDTDGDPVDLENDEDLNDIDPVDTDLPDNDIVVERCGNGITDIGEECDNGSFNSDEPGEVGVTCRKDCTYARCGDKIKDPGENCDDGNNLNGDYCSSDCKATTGFCGDGVVQTNEPCDKSEFGQGTGVYCADDCTAITGSCGDGVKQSNELCDKAETGDGIGPYYCSADCKTIIGACGDGIEQPNETCDSGEDNGRYGFCNPECDGLSSHCGDGVKDYGYEECDDGNNDSSDYCSSDCQTVTGFCGDTVIQTNEACDKSIEGDGIGAYCSSDCKTILGSCGDEIKQDNEDCDKGALNGNLKCDYGIEENCFACSATCRNVPGQTTFCGDGAIDVYNGEVCDKADFGSGTGQYCSFDCKTSLGSCGDGVKQDFEACDKATFNQGIGPEYCASDCNSIIGSCGDGTTQSNEDCDLGVGNTDYCAYGQTSCTVCSTACKNVPGITSLCGDQKIDTANEEICDEGANNGTYAPAFPGRCNSDCKGKGEGGYCGDSIEQASFEACDNGAENGKENCPYGVESCDVCTTSCAKAAGTVSFCGDGLIDTLNEEECDSGENNGQYGFCNADCSGNMPKCGDGNKDEGYGEVCDDGVENGQYGKCSTNCLSFMPKCGDSNLDSSFGELCDHGENNGVYKLEYPGYCNADCKGFGDGGYCGDGDIESLFEDCDHSGTIDLKCPYGFESCDVCNASCQTVSGVTAKCGDGFIHRSDCTGYANCIVIEGANEECDSGSNNGSYGFCKSDCSGIGPKCGDGFINRADCTGYTNCTETADANEECDDGLDNGEYGKCNSICSGPGPRCGDGIRQEESEACDMGESNGSYYFEAPGSCDADCQGYGEGGYCGDGFTDPTESCDSGENNGEYGKCKSDCSGDGPKCGDGFIDTVYDEDCDDGALNGTYGKCNSECSGIGDHCGDGIQNGTEQCDKGEENGLTECSYGQTSCTVCSETCTQSPGTPVGYCGDGSIQYGFGETCDHGGIIISDCNYGDPACEVCSFECKFISGNVVGYCGDGVTQRDDCSGYSNCVEVSGVNEECDSGNDNGWSGFCSEDCSYMTSCGDGTVDLGEICDTTDVQCSDYSQFTSGTVECPVDCSIPDASGCVDDPNYASPFFTTSQSLCYNNSVAVSCPAFGDPFYGQEPQFSYTVQSFVVDSDIVEESVSGLVWQKETPSSYAGCTKGTGSSQCTSAEASDYCENLDLGGFDDWRLPMGYELITIMDFAKSDPLAHSDFVNTQSGNYWAADSAISLTDGSISGGVPTEGGFVKCVRGDASGCAGCERYNFLEMERLIVDLVDVDANEVVFWYYDDIASAVDWEDALDYCAGITENGLSKFRLPTINELHSLVDRSSSNPAALVSSISPEKFWTSTTVHSQNSDGYVVDFSNGSVEHHAKTSTAYVICIK